MKHLEDFLKPTQNRLFQSLSKMYWNHAVCVKGKFLLVRDEVPVLLVAHLDTVHESPVRTICTSQQGNILMSPQGIGGDDRCGVYGLFCTTIHRAIQAPAGRISVSQRGW